jgi:drug/metabolite transporter (DMT)-like permease
VSRRLQGIAWMVASSVLWTLIEALGRHVPRGYSPYQTVWVRYMAHLLFMLAVLGPRHGIGLLRTQRPMLQVCRSLLMLGMAACFSVYVVMTRAMRDETTMANLFYTGLCVLAPLSLGLPAFWLGLRGRAAMAMGAIDLVGLAGLLALDRALHLAPASVVVPVAFL